MDRSNLTKNLSQISNLKRESLKTDKKEKNKSITRTFRINEDVDKMMNLMKAFGEIKDKSDYINKIIKENVPNKYKNMV